MEGYIKVAVQNCDGGNQIGVETRVKGVNVVDKILLIEAFSRALEMDYKELCMAVKFMPLVRDCHNTEVIKIDPKAFGGITDIL